MVKVSVIIATYRRTASLSEALLSLSRQTYRSFEIIVVDDNANDSIGLEVERIVHRFRSENAQIPIRLLKNRENLGSARSRNVGIQAASGSYVTFLDDDDLYLPDKIKDQLAYMEEQGCDYSATDLLLYRENGTLASKRVRDSLKDDLSAASLLRYHITYQITGTDTMMFRRDYLLKIGNFDPIDVGDEFYLLTKAIKGGGRFGYLHQCNVKAYVHDGDMGISCGKGKIDGENALYRYKKQFFPVLSFKERQYVRMRHFAVIAFTESKRKRYFRFLFYATLSFLSSPVPCARLFSEIGR